MKLNLNLTPTAKPTQRCTAPGASVAALESVPVPATKFGAARKGLSFTLLTAGAKRPVRIPPPIINVRPVLRGDKSYLRALRAAEMAIWNANANFPVVAVMLLAVLAIGNAASATLSLV